MTFDLDSFFWQTFCTFARLFEKADKITFIDILRKDIVE